MRSISGLSAHADQAELDAWIGHFARRRGDGRPRAVYVTHGEPAAASAFARRISRDLGATARRRRSADRDPPPLTGRPLPSGPCPPARLIEEARNAHDNGCKGQQVSGPWSFTAWTLVYAGIGALIMGFMNSLTYGIGIPGTEVTVRPHYGILTFFGFAFGPIVGFLTGFLGNAIGDYIIGGYVIDEAVKYWHWSVANGLVGLIAGLFPSSWRTG